MTRGIASFVVLLMGVPPPSIAQTPDRMAQTRAQEHYRAGQELLVTDAYAGAADEFRAAIDLDPAMPLAYYGLGQAYMGLKSYTQAVQTYTRCRQVYEEQAALAVDQGEKLNQHVETEIRALKDNLQQVEQRLRQAGGAGNRSLLQTQRQIEMRLQQLEHLRQRHDRPSNVPAGVALALGSAHLRAGQLDAAEREYLLALDGNPKMGEAHNNLAYVYMVTGRLADAQRSLKQAEKNGFRVNPAFKDELKQKTP